MKYAIIFVLIFAPLLICGGYPAEFESRFSKGGSNANDTDTDTDSKLGETYKIENREHLKKTMERLLNDTDSADMEIFFEDSEISYKVHSVILKHASDTFKESGKKVKISHLDPSLFPIVLDYLYTGSCLINESAIPTLLAYADLLQLPQFSRLLNNATNNFLLSFNLLHTLSSPLPSQSDITKLLLVIQNADNLSNNQTLQKALQVLDFYMEQAIMNPQFLQISEDLLAHIYSRNSLHISEEKLFLGLLIWARKSGNLDVMDDAQYDVAQIHENTQILFSLKSLIELVNYNCIDPEILVNKIAKTGIVDVEILNEAYEQHLKDHFEGSGKGYFEPDICRTDITNAYKWKLDYSPSLVLSDDGKSVWNNNAKIYDSEIAVLNTVWSKGKHMYEVKITKSLYPKSPDIFIGFSTADENVMKYYLRTWSGQAVVGNYLDDYADKPIELGESIEICLNYDEGTIAFAHNGENLGIAFHNVKEPLIPAVALTKGEGVQLVQIQNYN